MNAAFQKQIKQIWPDIPNHIARELRQDVTLALMGSQYLDIIETDKNLANLLPGYDPDKATYKGEPCSMEEAARMIDPKLADLIGKLI